MENDGGNGFGGNLVMDVGANAGVGNPAVDVVVDRAEKVLNQVLGRCGKRPFFPAEGDRPLKRRRLNMDGDAADAEFFPEITNGVMGNIGGSGVLGTHRGHFVTMVNGSAGCGALADWDAFNDVPLSEEFLVPVANEVFEHLPVGAHAVRISKHMFVRQIIKKLNLNFHSYKVVIEESGSYRACIEFDLPRVVGRRFNMRKKFYGLDEKTKYGAMESACESALSHLVLKCQVVVKDINYCKSKMLEYSCAAADGFNKQFMEMVKLKDSESLKMSLDLSTAVAVAQLACKKLSDAVPLKSVLIDGPGDYGNNRVVYDGKRPPVCTLDELALAFASLMDDVMSVIEKKPK